MERQLEEASFPHRRESRSNATVLDNFKKPEKKDL